jgi:hypothetical protein
MSNPKLSVRRRYARGEYYPEATAFVHIPKARRCIGCCIVRYSKAKDEGPLSSNSKNLSKLVWRGVKSIALGVLLVPSALLMAVAIGSDEYSWFAWFGLLPLFLAIRVLSPAVAALAGMLWGGCFYLFLAVGVVTGLSVTSYSFALLAIVLMLYAYFGVILTRWVGFSPILLAMGWFLVEIALTPLGLNQGLLAGTQGTTP